MAESTTEVIAGGAVLAVALGFLIYAAQGTGFARTGGSYDLRASFQSAEGISVGTDVRLAGVKVGTVSKLDLNPQTFYADAVFSIRNGVDLPTDSAALVSSEGLLGGNFIELRPGGLPDNLAAGDEIEDTQGSVSLVGLLMKFVGKSASDAMSGDAGATE
ncbi:phospholipid/cholesterol/gamma-HCH transport system substrate-binding protein [Gemmobacter caeni]|jgi:phospholipid/cholesterol/gamma-HCH transport system substrate-binding protein|uniref:Phospholipid/cholesterol/gamma-HCH transport system substrate-binding protein n=2 Tax=Gemmobacter TaxID=204456 RepID=A0A2T6ARG7_9RHOB|nr:MULTISPECIES: outer membrane lipid asymmetry maintenance protein MlaD [Gemmobacter]OJY29000.1 MAG: outer membrane lipid asymmetry maintenance protein MlaD [Rhodobacterales bacterium 65-51]PTX46413.1 phospholipid/cholesterol/gamma-HCH transport system substrate-binding protein [Gemmobacter caeni]TWI95245.1 phospholipid/cholesterol/gamma-HCH transport system substrate-binding protein [Gemmobacter caeni]GHC10682.1 outer membrane lipid asymmetry maintenance protein MlaD [Gemmobacter nanjingensis